MRRIALAVATAALTLSPLVGAQTAQAAQTTTPDKTVTAPARRSYRRCRCSIAAVPPDGWD